ncbi:MAG: transcriptional regulator PpsR [Pseudomonadota bacterium]
MNTRESDFWNERAGPRIAPEFFGDIVATAADLALVIGEGGTIVSVTKNPLNSAIGSVTHWEGRKIADFLAPDSVGKVERHLNAVRTGAANRPDSIEVNHQDGAVWDFPVKYTMHPTGREGRILMLGRDMRPVAELQQRLVKAQLALERDYDNHRVFETRYRVLMDASRDALALVDVGSGRILDLNEPAATLLGGEGPALANSAFTQCFEGRRRSSFIEELCGAAMRDGETVTAETRNGAACRIDPRLFRAGGERMLLCHLSAGSEARPVPEALVSRMDALFRSASDGIVIAGPDGKILQANDAFLSLAEVDAVSDLRGRPMSDFLLRGSVDFKVLVAADRPRVFSTRMVSAHGTQLPVDVSAIDLENGEHIFTLRDTGRGDLAREMGPSSQMDDTGHGMRSDATSLVGTVPLRDIVASMTDVVEKQCIETAVDLTKNNRVAAAEMLGLSRQSLYVKLRKYGLLQRDEM